MSLRLRRSRAVPSSRGSGLMRVGAALLMGHGLRLVSAIVITPLQFALVGVNGFALLVLISSLPTWLAALDLGISGVARTHYAGFAPNEADPTFRRLSSILICGTAVLFLLLVSPCLFFTNWLTSISSVPLNHARWAILAFLIFFAMGIPGSVSLAVLEARGMAAKAALLGSATPVLTLAGTFAIEVVGGGLPALGGVIGVGIAAPRCLALMLEQRSACSPSVTRDHWTAQRMLTRAWPLGISALLWGLAFGLDPLLISYAGTQEQVAQYGAVTRVFALVMTVPLAMSTALWGQYARLRAQQIPQVWHKRVTSDTFIATGIAITGATLFAVATPHFLALWISGLPHGGIRNLTWAFGLLLAVQLSTMPITAALTSHVEMRQQSIGVAVMCIANLTLSFATVSPLGATGPVLASAVTLLLFHRLPLVTRFVRLNRDVTADRAPLLTH